MYQTELLQLDLDSLLLQILQITNVDDLLEALIAKGAHHEDVQDERIPYWAELWPAAIGLSQHLWQFDLIQPGMTVTEIGCGLGLPSIVAGKKDATVTLTDYLPEALDFARQNWRLNHAHPAHFALLDWRNPDPKLAADLVLASDVTYEKRFFKFLPHAFQALCRPGGSILVSDPNREAARHFFDNVDQEGFSVQKFNYEVYPPLGGPLTPVSVYHLQPH